MNVRNSPVIRRLLVSLTALAGAITTAAYDDSAQLLAHEWSASAANGNRTTAEEKVVVRGAYALPALNGGTGGAFMTIVNSGTDTVRISGASSADAKAVELHESMEHNGTTHMQMLQTLDIAPGASTALKAGGKHFMLIGLRRKLLLGDTTRVVLRVANVINSRADVSSARNIAVAVPVRIP